MKKWSLLLMFLLVASMVEAAPAKPAKRCVKCSHPCATTHTATSYNALGALLDGFSLTAGFRWDRECPTPENPSPEGNHDPFFVGAEMRLPLNSWADLGGNIDRDFVDAPHWNARVFIAAHPWRK